MKTKNKLALLIPVTLLAASCATEPMAPKNPMTFFVTSAGSGKGADLGGLAAADRQCQTLAEAVGAGGPRTWRAYLSTSTFAGGQLVNARDRIGGGPWQNANGVVIAKSVDDLHSANSNITKQTAVTEKGAVVNGRGDKPNMHDILTGSDPDGRAYAANADSTCRNWTSSAADGAGMVGHHDRQGLDESAAAKSWNSSHPSRGCSHANLQSSGGDGRFYCFALR